jgi:thiol-disulfide isomerase/thioredoxin
MKLISKLIVIVLLFCSAAAQGQEFDSTGISRARLDYYLKRAVTMAEFLAVDPYANDGPYPYKKDDVRLIHNIGAKFIGRAIYRWGNEATLANPDFLKAAMALIKEVHSKDPEVIFQAAVFEAVTGQVNRLPIPDWAFIALGRKVEVRNFRYDDMLDTKGKFINHWGKGSSVPDITRPEAQLWLMYLCGVYMNLGCEALHLGQVALMGMNDPGLRVWNGFVRKVRNYARTHTAHHWVLLDAHTPQGGMVIDGKSMLDFNSFPLRIKEIPEKPMEGVLQVGYLDAIFQRSMGCITPSGWKCEALPYLVEFDNFGISRNPGVADTASHFIWGYDEITWFYLLPEEKRNAWLRYAHHWVAANDPTGWLQMPISRIVSLGRGNSPAHHRGNIRSKDCPIGVNVEQVVKEIWVDLNQGTWRAALLREDGFKIPFGLDFKREGGNLACYILNGTERMKTENIVASGDSILIRMPVFESYFRLKVITKDSLNGVWIKGGAAKDVIIPVTATAGKSRFPKVKQGATGQAGGKWSMEFTRANQTKRPAVGEFVQNGHFVTGSVLTPAGDYRYLDGIVKGDSLFLSTFDGIHALLFAAEISGETINGYFYSSASVPERFIAHKDANVKLTAPVTAVKAGSDGKLNFSFKDLDGNTVSLQSERYRNKVVVVQLMGSWCPNCMDEMAFLSEYYRKNKDRGVEVIALAYELTTDEDRSRKSLRKFQQQFKVQYPMLITGVAVGDPARTEKTLPQLTEIKVFPTTIIIDKNGVVNEINTSFYGPATGQYHLDYKADFERRISALLRR